MNKSGRKGGTYRLNWFMLFWFGAVVLAFYLFFSWQIEKFFLGIVERGTHVVTSQESGRIQTLLVKPGDYVTAEQLLVVLNFSDLKQSLENMQAELHRLQQLEKVLQATEEMQVQRLYLRLSNEANDLLRRMADIESKSAELASVNDLIKQFQDAQEAGLGYNRELADLYIRRDALKAYLEQLRKQAATQQTPAEVLDELNKSLQNVDLNDLNKAMYIDRLRYMDELQREIIKIEQRINARNLTAPCEGYVTTVNMGAGDIVKAFDHILTVEVARPVHLIVYIPEKSTIPLTVGAPVKIYSSRSSYTTSGTISFIHPGFTRAEERISFRGQVFWARKVQVDLPPDHQLIPGEVVKVKINGRIHNAKTIKGKNQASAASGELQRPISTSLQPSLMTVPQSLLSQTTLEPSGVAWSPAIGKFLIVSDDTGIKNSQNEHLPMIFLMDENGQVAAIPSILRGLNSLNDIEGITTHDDQIYYLISSQNISKKNKRPLNREFLLQVVRNGGTFIIQRKVNLLSQIIQTYSPSELAQLGLKEKDRDGKPILNIEGIAFDGKALYLGLKQPVTELGAIIWKLDKPETLFAQGRLALGQLALYGIVELQRKNDYQAGISDLCHDKAGRLWALSTFAKVSPAEQQGGLHLIEPKSSGEFEAKCLYTFPEMKPEGLGFKDQNRLMIVFDCDGNLPLYCYVNLQSLALE